MISNSLDIDFIHGDINGQSYKKICIEPIGNDTTVPNWYIIETRIMGNAPGII